MSAPGSHLRPTYSVRLFRAFAEILEDEGPARGPSYDRSRRSRANAVLVEVAHQALSMAVATTGDPDLGLKAARRLVLGDIGTVADYVVGSAPTVRDAVEASVAVPPARQRGPRRPARVRRLFRHLEARQQRRSRAACRRRFRSGRLLPSKSARLRLVSTTALRRQHVWFTHQAPGSIAEYERTFAPAVLRFNAPCFGFSFARRAPRSSPRDGGLESPAGRGPLRQSLTRSILSVAKTVTSEVRVLVEEQLPSGAPDVADVASQLGMSMRTLARRLESEGTTFRDVIDDVRRRVALESVKDRKTSRSPRSLTSLGFSHGAAFHRAFRRWDRTDAARVSAVSRALRGVPSGVDRRATSSSRR